MMMKRSTKKIMIMMLLLANVGLRLHARGGDAFAGGMAGGMFGGLLGSAVSRSNSSDGGGSRYALRAIERLEDAVRKDLEGLQGRIDRNRSDIRDMQDRLHDVEYNSEDIRKLKDQVRELQERTEKIERAMNDRLREIDQRLKKLEVPGSDSQNSMFGEE